MKKKDFLIDKITECIEEVATGKIFETDLKLVTKAAELKGVTKRNGWDFKWKEFLKIPGRQVYKLVIKDDPNNVIQGLISIQVQDGWIEMHHIENASHNFSKAKQYAGVCGNMVAFACKLSFDLKFDGYVGFIAKTNLIEHYIETLGASLIFPKQNRMSIDTNPAKNLVNSYYKDYFNA